jgi:transposase
MSLSLFPRRNWSGPSNRSKNRSVRLSGFSRKTTGFGRNWKRPCGRVSGRLHRIPGAEGRPIRNGLAANPAVTTASTPAAPARRAWMSGAAFRCRGSARIAEAAWSFRAPGAEAQYQEEIVRRTVVRRFDIAVGCCQDCGRRVQGRHPLQTSDAVGVGGVQLGPEALALVAILNKQMGLSLGHTRQVLAYGFGLQVSCSGLYRGLARMSRRAAPTYAGLVKATRQALVNVPDETGWRVGGHLQWMHVTVSAQVTVYAILPGRGYEQSRLILGADYDGFLVHDGWAPYYRFVAAFHPSCLRHLLVRCQEMVQIASAAAAAFPLGVKDLLQASLQLRDRYQEGEISEHGLRTATGRLEAQLDRLLEKPYRDPANRRLAKHLEHERPFLFTFLYCPGLDATNHEAERAVRWMVIARKVWGGNRTWAGAWTQQILVSVLRTCWQQDKDPFPRLISLLCSPRDAILDIVPGAG